MTSARLPIGQLLRISSDRAGLGLGVERQSVDNHALADRRHWQIIETYSDNDRSAYRGRFGPDGRWISGRPEYERCLSDLRTGVIKGVVAYHPDRIFGHPRELEDLIDLIEQHGVVIATVEMGSYDLATAGGRLIARQLGAASRYEREMKAARHQRKHLEIAQAGKPSGGGTRAFGFEADKITVIDDEADEIRSAAARLLAGASVLSIVKDWNERGVPTVTGAPWSSTSVRQLFRSARISGQRTHKGQIVGPAVWPAIISPQDTARLRALLNRPVNSGPISRTYLLTGLLVCSRCGSKMSGSKARGTLTRYRCQIARGGCGRCSVSASQLDALVTEAVILGYESMDLAAIHASRTARDAADEAAEAYALVVTLESELEQLASDHYRDHIITRPQFLSVQPQLQSRLEEARTVAARYQPVSALNAVVPDVEALRGTWPTIETHHRRAIIGAVVKSITVGEVTRAGPKFDPERITITWLT